MLSNARTCLMSYRENLDMSKNNIRFFTSVIFFSYVCISYRVVNVLFGHVRILFAFNAKRIVEYADNVNVRGIFYDEPMAIKPVQINKTCYAYS